MLKTDQSLAISNDLLFMNKELDKKKDDIRKQ
jgi:hypothetical protein